MRAVRSSGIIAVALAALVTTGCESRVGGVSRILAPGSSASLTGLSISGASLSPSFNAANRSYSASVSNAVDAVTVTPSAGAGASVTINGTPTSGPTQVTLAEGTNTVNIGVTGSTGTTTTYTVTITRAPSPTP